MFKVVPAPSLVVFWIRLGETAVVFLIHLPPLPPSTLTSSSMIINYNYLPTPPLTVSDDMCTMS